MTAAGLLLALAACGGGDAVDEMSQARALAASQPVVLTPQGPNAVSRWNGIATATAAQPASPAGATLSERVGSPGTDVTTVQLAVYDALAPIAGTHEAYGVQPGGPAAGASMDAAVAEAAYRVLLGLFPSRAATYEAAHTADLAAIADGEAKARGIALGAQSAAGWLALRANDGRDVALTPYVPGTAPGDFRGLNPVNRIAPFIKPFAMQDNAQFRVPAPPALGSAAYAASLNETRAFGGTVSAQRTPAQAEQARFFAEPPDPYTNRNLQRLATVNTALFDNARLLAMLWVVRSDSVGGCFESKYFYQRWRPLSAIPLADTDGNAATVPDVSWTPFLPTPNHPEYPAAHSCVHGGIAEVLRSFYGTKRVVFDFDSLGSHTTRHYEWTDDLVRDSADARVYGGMHFRFSTEAGADLGKAVGQWVTQHRFRALKQ